MGPLLGDPNFSIGNHTLSNVRNIYSAQILARHAPSQKKIGHESPEGSPRFAGEYDSRCLGS